VNAVSRDSRGGQVYFDLRKRAKVDGRPVAELLTLYALEAHVLHQRQRRHTYPLDSRPQTGLLEAPSRRQLGVSANPGAIPLEFLVIRREPNRVRSEPPAVLGLRLGGISRAQVGRIKRLWRASPVDNPEAGRSFCSAAAVAFHDVEIHSGHCEDELFLVVPYDLD
jgi:hypothetical protein